MNERMKNKLKIFKRDSQSGFTLIEMLTVCAIIGILATMAIASMRGGKAAAFETMCIGALKHINEGESLFYSRYNRFTTWQGLKAEGDLIDPKYTKVDNPLDPHDSPIALLYSIRIYSYSTNYSAIAYPIDLDTWYLRTFAVDSDGSILNNRDNPEYPLFN
jgi:prepilin-type N-terminal cleavage/methylation domain-containing protein